MSRSARLALAFVCALCAAFIAMPATAMADEPEVSRAQWVHKIVETFDVTIEQAVYPEEYFTDISEDDPYYEDFVLALEFGIIDEPLGGEVRPMDAATRDFAAHTLNYCLGYQLQEEGYTFSDSAEDSGVRGCRPGMELH